MTDNTAVLDSFSTMWQVLEDNARTSSKQPAVREKAFGIWQTWSWRDYNENANRLILASSNPLRLITSLVDINIRL